jgi:hypothetical protein
MSVPLSHSSRRQKNPLLPLWIFPDSMSWTRDLQKKHRKSSASYAYSLTRLHRKDILSPSLLTLLHDRLLLTSDSQLKVRYPCHPLPLRSSPLVPSQLALCHLNHARTPQIRVLEEVNALRLPRLDAPALYATAVSPKPVKGNMSTPNIGQERNVNEKTSVGK